MTRAKPTLYLPIEISARELDARLLLAHRALAAGYRVVLGQQWLLVNNLARFAPGVVFFKGLNRIQRNWMTHARKFGHKIAAIDEEATAIADARFITKEVTAEAMSLLDRAFMQGAVQHNVYSDSFPQFASALRITGNPRWDLLRPEFQRFFAEEITRIHACHGKFILLNTNMGFANSSWGSPQKFIQICVNVGYIDPKDPFDQKWLKDQYAFERQNFAGFRALAVQLRDRYPSHKIVLRPHPAENIEAWRSALADQQNVDVITEGSVVPWIMAADVLVHNTCTTGIEGFLLGRPTIAYCPYTNWCEPVFISNLITPRTSTFDELAGLVDGALADPTGFVEEMRLRYLPTLREHFRSVDEEELATDRIFREVVALKDELVGAESETLLRPGKTIAPLERPDYQRAKISFTEPELRSRFDLIAGAIGSPLRYEADLIGDSLLAMEAA